MFCGEVFRAPFIDMVDRMVEKNFVVVYFHGVQWVVGGVLWFM